MNQTALFKSCKLTVVPHKLRELEAVCKIARANQIVYNTVSLVSGIPWVLIAAIHFRESSQSFKLHLHNGDSLSARTVHVPEGRPLKGQPPFTWAESAIDALKSRKAPEEWTLETGLEFLECYNGLGYRKFGINTPYLWDFTDKYVKGLFRKDRQFDPEYVEQRPGCAAILKMLEQQGVSLELPTFDESDPSLH